MIGELESSDFQILFYKEENGRVPVLEWLDHLEIREPKAYSRCVVKINLLRSLGQNIRRPHADYLRDKIYELRAYSGGKHYRILYFFYGREAVVLTSSLVKERKVPAIEIERAIQRMQKFSEDPLTHSHDEELAL